MSNKPVTIVISITAIVVTSAALKSIAKYGWKGTFRYIWIGDHLTPDVRESTDALEHIELKCIPKELKRLNKLEIVISTASLNSVDEGEMKKDEMGMNQEEDRNNAYYMYAQIPSLSKDLGTLSYNLDKLAANVDAVQSYGNETVRRKKKDLSNRIVKMMNSVDFLIETCGFD
jgi:hypothetical protein